MPQPNIDVTGETSNTEAELNAKIDAELGLPSPPTTDNETDTTTENDTDTTTTDDDSGDGETQEEGTDTVTSDEDDTEEVDDEEEDTRTEPATPSDEELFIEVEDADGVTHKISKIEDLPEDFALKNNRQGLEIMRSLEKLDRQIEKRDADNAEAARKAGIAETQQRQLASWDSEVTELGKQKRLDIKDTELIDNVFKTMNKLNTARAEAGNPNRITSFEDALMYYERDAAATKEADAQKNDNERAKIKSSLIGRSSSGGKGEAPVYVAGSYRNIDDIPLG